MNPVIATCIHADEGATRPHVGQGGGDPAATPVQSVEWRCVLTFFGTSLRWNSGCRHVLVTDLADLPGVEGVSVERWLDAHGVEVIRSVKLSRVTPEGFWGPRRDQFYVFDALKAAGDGIAGWDGLYLFDSACIWLAPHERLSAAVMKEEAAVYTLPFGPDHVENGVVVGDLGLIGRALMQRPLRAVPTYNGGELIALARPAFDFIMDHIDKMYAANLDAFASGRPYLKEEAHFLSILFALMGIPSATANGVIRRIRTGRKGNDQEPADAELDIWHLPDEKRLGLPLLFRTMMRAQSWFWRADAREFRQRAGSLVGIPKRSPAQFQWAKIVNKVGRMISQRPLSRKGTDTLEVPIKRAATAS